MAGGLAVRGQNDGVRARGCNGRWPQQQVRANVMMLSYSERNQMDSQAWQVPPKLRTQAPLVMTQEQEKSG